MSLFLPLSSVQLILTGPSSGIKNWWLCASSDFIKPVIDVPVYFVHIVVLHYMISCKGSGCFLLIKYSEPLAGEVIAGSAFFKHPLTGGVMCRHFFIYHMPFFKIALHFGRYGPVPFLFIPAGRLTGFAIRYFFIGRDGYSPACYRKAGWLKSAE